MKVTPTEFKLGEIDINVQLDKISRDFLQLGMDSASEQIKEIKNYNFERKRDPLIFDSVIGFLNFCKRKILVQEPIIGVAANGCFGVDWYLNEDDVITILFFDKNKLFYSIDIGESSNSGRTNIDGLLKLLDKIKGI